MKVWEILEFWKHAVPEGWDNTCDQLHYGDMDAEVGKVAVCFKITLANLTEMLRWGAQMIFTHEPLYPAYDGPLHPDEADPVARALHDRLVSSGAAVLRLHDHAHLFPGDFIHMGFIKKLDLPIQFVLPPRQLGITQYGLARAYTTREIAALITERLNVAHPRIAGNPDVPVTRIVLALGGTGNLGYDILSRSDAELFISGEVSELGSAFYANDAAYLGLAKCLLVLGHCESEQDGMALLADWFCDQHPSLETRFFPAGPTYQY